MDLSQISTDPVLVEIVLDDEETIKDYKESLSFWTYDRQPLDTYLAISGAMGVDQPKMVGILKKLILNKEGQPVMVDDKILPAKVMVKAMTKVIELLGK